MKLKQLTILVLACLMALSFSGFSAAGTLTDIVKRGELRVAVQSGAPPMPLWIKTGSTPAPW